MLRRPVVLASASPRRRELLAEVVPDFTVDVADVDEEALTVADPWATAEGLALAKARAVLQRNSEAIVIGGDTVVAIPSGEGGNHVQLAKPRSVAEAREMLRQLSGRTHLVITGVCLAQMEGERTFSETTEVTFRTLGETEIVAYVATGEPMDKAGAYAIQGGAADFVAKREGSLSNVIGLPVERLAAEIAELRTMA